MFHLPYSVKHYNIDMIESFSFSLNYELTKTIMANTNQIINKKS